MSWCESWPISLPRRACKPSRSRTAWRKSPPPSSWFRERIAEIYSRGQQVAVHRVNAGLPVEKLFDDVVGFLRSTGQNAVQQGMIPRLDSSGEPQVGSLTAAEIAKLVEKVREYNGFVRIRAVAATQYQRRGFAGANLQGRAVTAAPSLFNSMAEHAPTGPTVLAIDPGRAKCGIAVVSAECVLHREIALTGELAARAGVLLGRFSPEWLVVGRGTGSAPIIAALESIRGETALVPVDRSHTSELARARYLRETPPRGLRRLLPAFLRSPENPYDDYVAVILAERWLKENYATLKLHPPNSVF